MNYIVCEDADYENSKLEAYRRLEELDRQYFENSISYLKMSPYEQRVQELKDEGIPPAEARRIALQEIRELRQIEKDNRQVTFADKRNSQANFRIGLGITRILLSLFKSRR